MHGPKRHVTPTPTSQRPHKLMTLCTVSMGLANHETLLDVGVDMAFSETSLHNLHLNLAVFSVICVLHITHTREPKILDF